MAGRHRASRRGPWLRAGALLVASALALTAAAICALADDSQLLRVAVVTALVGALLPTLLLMRAPDAAAASAPHELAAVRRELAELRADLAQLAAQRDLWSAPLAVPPRPTAVLQLPLVRAALRVPVQSANGHGHTVDLTEPEVTTQS
jgi:hypothetical protein